jgi:hypothetical protein
VSTVVGAVKSLDICEVEFQTALGNFVMSQRFGYHWYGDDSCGVGEFI